jgi:KaiC/GvpD/RAD55 family RecA-like ATPase
MPSQPIKKQDAPVGAGASSENDVNHELQQRDYTATIEEGKEHFEAYLQALPPEMRASFERFNQDAIRKTLRKKELTEYTRGKMLSRRQQIELLTLRARGEFFEDVDDKSFSEPWRKYWQALQNAAPGKELEVLKTIASEEHLKQISQNSLEDPTFSALAELQAHIKDVSWYWDYRIPNGKITVLGGESGVSKSMLAQRICYMQIHETQFPDGAQIRKPGEPVLYVDCEGFAAGIKMRANAWGMDISKFYLWSVDLESDGFINFSNPVFRDELIERVNYIKPALVVVDSFGNASEGGQDKVEDVRDLLNFLNKVAYDHDLALILVAHTRKPPAMFTGKGEINQDDICGSGHVVAMARSVIGVWLVQTGSEPDPNGPRIMAVLKSNFGRKPKPIGYEVLNDANDNPKIFFGDAPKPYKEPTKMEQCAEWVLDTLAEAGEPMPPKELEALAYQAGFKRDTFYAAHRSLEKDRLIKDTHGNKDPDNSWTLV